MVAAEERCADGPVGDDPGQRIEHVVRRRGERDSLDQDQSVVDGLRPEKLREHAEQDVVLAGDVDRVAGRVGLVPVGAEYLFPAVDHIHPVRDLGLRRPGDNLLQQRRLLLGKFLQRVCRDRVALQALVHEGDVVLQNAAAGWPPVVVHRGRVKTVERGLHAVPVRRQRATPSQIVGTIQIGNDHFGQRHGAVADGFEQLIDDRNRRRVDRRHPGAIEDELSAGPREQPEDERMPSQDVLLEHLPGIAVKLEHGGVELQDIPGPDLGGACRLGADDLIEVGRQVGGMRRQA